MTLYTQHPSQPPSQAFYKMLSEAAGKLYYAYIIALLFPLLVLAVGILAAGGLAALREITGGSILEFLDTDEAIVLGAIVGAATIAVVDAYLYYSGAATLKKALDTQQSPSLIPLHTPATLIHIGAIITIIGLITIPALVGLILAPIGYLLYTIGIILLGSNLKILGPEYASPGSLLMVGAILQLVSIATIYLIVTSILYIVATILVAKALRYIRDTSRRQAHQPPHSTTGTGMHQPGDQLVTR